MRIIAFLMALVFGFVGFAVAVDDQTDIVSDYSPDGVDNGMISDYVIASVSAGHDYLLPTASTDPVTRAMVRLGTDSWFLGGGLRYQETPGFNVFAMRRLDFLKIDMNEERNFFAIEALLNGTMLGGEIYRTIDGEGIWIDDGGFSFAPKFSFVSDLAPYNWVPSLVYSFGSVFSTKKSLRTEFGSLGLRGDIGTLKYEVSVITGDDGAGIDMGLSVIDDAILSPEIHLRNTTAGSSFSLRLSKVLN